MSSIETKTFFINPNQFPECSNCQIIKPYIDNSFNGIGEEIQSSENGKLKKIIINIQCMPVDIIESDEVYISSFRILVNKKVSKTVITSNSINTCPGLINWEKKKNKKILL